FGKLKGKNIDYVALGHIHEYRIAKIDSRCTAVYSGCLEGRGFDECGKKGYVLMETVNNRITHRFVPFATRELHTVICDVTDSSSLWDLEQRLLHSVENIPQRDLVKVLLRGAVCDGMNIDLAHLRGLLEERFYFAKLRNESKLLIRPEEYQNDISLKGEFVRRVMASELSEQEKDRVIACGLSILAGEEVRL
ncbi:MAG: DNA repair exonuclease, partial [Clostridia bacterium]|nr:DNA repair exonuclease [Clostridia bacterium]